MITDTWHYKTLNGNEQQIGKLLKDINYLIVNYPVDKNREPDANQIMQMLWLGNFHAAHDFNFITSRRIKTIINITKNIPNKFDFIDYINYYVDDEDACKKNLFHIMNDGADIINNSIIDKRPVLVHCKKGHHRSASMIVFYLMKYHNVSLVDGIRLIKLDRPKAFTRMICILKILIWYEIEKNNTSISRRY